jgi:hypothetical protein
MATQSSVPRRLCPAHRLAGLVKDRIRRSPIGQRHLFALHGISEGRKAEGLELWAVGFIGLEVQPLVHHDGEHQALVVQTMPAKHAAG